MELVSHVRCANCALEAAAELDLVIDFPGARDLVGIGRFAAGIVVRIAVAKVQGYVLRPGRALDDDERLTTVEATPKRLDKIDVSIQKLKEQIGTSIQKLENRIYYECQQVGEFQNKDIDSLLKMVEQRTKELRSLRDRYFTMEKDSDDEPLFVSLREMENNWLSIEDFLRTEQKWYNSVIVKCTQTPKDATSPGG